MHKPKQVPNFSCAGAADEIREQQLGLQHGAVECRHKDTISNSGMLVLAGTFKACPSLSLLPAIMWWWTGGGVTVMPFHHLNIDRLKNDRKYKHAAVADWILVLCLVPPQKVLPKENYACMKH